MKKVPKFKDLKFNSIREFKDWLRANTFKIINLEDNGQDMQNVWIDKEGEILHCDFHSSIYNGKFVNLDVLKVGSMLQVWENDDEDWFNLDRLIIYEIKNKAA